MTDEELLRRYGAGEGEEAFAELARRHAGWVYGVARRQGCDGAMAEDVTQAVFVLLARKAKGRWGKARVTGWLFRTAWNVARAARRAERRRRLHERRAAMRMDAVVEEKGGELAEVVDGLVKRLPERDRIAVVLRFYQGLGLREVGEALGTSEDGAAKQVERAVGRLRKKMAARGVVWSAAGLLMVAEAAKAAPAGLAGRVAAAAQGKAGAGVVGLVKAALRRARMKGLASVGAGSIAAAVVAWSFLPSGRAAADIGAPGRVMRVHVVDEGTGKGVVGARVTADGPGEWGTGPDGVALIGMPAGEPMDWAVHVEAGGYLRQDVEWMDQERISGLPGEVEVRVGHGEKIGGRVVDETGKGVVGARVTFMGSRLVRDAEHPLGDGSSTQMRNPAAEAVTDGNGAWWMETPLDGGSFSWGLIVHGDGWYVPWTQLEVNAATLPGLRRGEWTVTARKAGGLEVTAVRSDGKPAVGARIWVWGSGPGGGGTEGKTGADGKAVMTDVPTGMVSITVECADQMAAVVKRNVEAGGTLAQRVELKAAAPVRGQVVDGEGRGMAGVQVHAAWEGSRWQQLTDGDGRFEWVGAPAEAARVFVNPVGAYPPKGEILVKAGEENKIVCGKLTHVGVVATDAETGRAVAGAEAFEVLDPAKYGLQESDAAMGDATGKVDAWFFTSGRTHWLKVSAPRHYPVVLGPYGDGLGDVKVAVALNAGRGVAGVVLGPDGKAVNDAMLTAAPLPRGELQILDGTPNRAESVNADGSGHFEMMPREEAGWIWVSAAEGYAWVRDEDAGEVRLRPWGRVTLEAQRDGKPARGSLFVQWGGKGEMAAARYLEMSWRDVWTDGNGRATIERVPEGSLSVQMNQAVQTGNGAGGGERRYSGMIDVAAGKTTEVKWMGGGVVTGRVAVPESVGKGWRSSESVLTQEGPAIDVPVGFNGWGEKDKTAWMMEHAAAQKRVAGETYAFRAPVNVEPDGKFRVTDVPAGTYTLRLRIGVPVGPGEPQGDEYAGDVEGVKALGEVICHLVVPAGNGPVDVGELAMGPSRKVEVGKMAPEFGVLTLDGKKGVRLSDLRGKWVVVDCWATWCAPCVAETPNVRAVAEAYGKQGLVVLDVDYDSYADLDKAREYVTREGLVGEGWVQTMAMGWGSGELESYALGLPQIYLIDPQGKVAARGLRGAGMVGKIGDIMRAAGK